MFNPVLGSFTKEDRDACLPIINTLLSCGDKARREGVLALEDFVVKQDNDFLTFATMLIVDGTDPDLVKAITETLISSGNHSGSALLERLIIAEGVLSVQAGENPRIIEMKLLSMLGESYLKDRGHFPPQPLFPEDVNQRIATIASEDVSPEFEDFNKIMQVLHNRGIQCILREVDFKELSIALKGCSEAVVMKLCGNMSPRLAVMILEDIEHMGPVDISDVLKAQEAIKNIMKRLEDSGEIIVWNTKDIISTTMIRPGNPGEVTK